MSAINWILTFCSIVTTSVAFGRVVWEGEAEITLVPITAILTLPAIRNLYLGAPPFVNIPRRVQELWCLSLPRIEKVPFRRVGVLLANADSGVVHGDI